MTTVIMYIQAVNNYVDALKYVPEGLKSEEMWDKSVDTCLFAFHFIPDWFKTQKMWGKVFSEDSFILNKYFFAVGLLQVKWLKNFIILYSQIMFNFFFDEDSGKSHFQVMKWVFLVWILTIEALMISILIKMILKLLLMLDFLLGIKDTKILKTWSIYKGNKRRINACSIAFNKMVRFVYARRWEKINRTIFFDEK